MKHIDPVKDMRSHKKRPIRKEHPPPRSTFIKDYSDDWMERSRELMREKIFEAIDESDMKCASLRRLAASTLWTEDAVRNLLRNMMEEGLVELTDEIGIGLVARRAPPRPPKPPEIVGAGNFLLAIEEL